MSSLNIDFDKKNKKEISMVLNSYDYVKSKQKDNKLVI